MADNGCDTRRPEAPTEDEKLQQLIEKIMGSGKTLVRSNVKTHEMTKIGMPIGSFGIGIFIDPTSKTEPRSQNILAYVADKNDKPSAHFKLGELPGRVEDIRKKARVAIEFIDPKI